MNLYRFSVVQKIYSLNIREL